MLQVLQNLIFLFWYKFLGLVEFSVDTAHFECFHSWKYVGLTKSNRVKSEFFVDHSKKRKKNNLEEKKVRNVMQYRGVLWIFHRRPSC